MARYFFDVYDDGVVTADVTGIECSDLGDLRYKAIDALPEIARDTLPDGDRHVIEVCVRDERGVPVFRCGLSLTTEWISPAHIRFESERPPAGIVEAHPATHDGEPHGSQVREDP